MQGAEGGNTTVERGTKSQGKRRAEEVKVGPKKRQKERKEARKGEKCLEERKTAKYRLQTGDKKAK